MAPIGTPSTLSGFDSSSTQPVDLPGGTTCPSSSIRYPMPEPTDVTNKSNLGWDSNNPNLHPHEPRHNYNVDNFPRVHSRTRETFTQNHWSAMTTAEHTPRRSYSHQPIDMTIRTNRGQHHSLPTHDHYSQHTKRRFTAGEEVDNFLAGMAKDIKRIIVNAHQRDPEANTRVQNPEVHLINWKFYRLDGQNLTTIREGSFRWDSEFGNVGRIV